MYLSCFDQNLDASATHNVRNNKENILNMHGFVIRQITKPTKLQFKPLLVPKTCTKPGNKVFAPLTQLIVQCLIY